VVNLYGPTEDTTYSTWAVVPREAGVGREPTIGRPVANTRVYVLDERMELMAEGVHGELYLGGEGLARGYLNRPELTAERFVPDPFSTETGGRLYRTGDVVRWRGGELEYLGRADAQVKVRGFRIELGEIESALREHAGVRECVVAARDHEEGRRLVGYVVAEAGAEAGAGELRSFLKERLPLYMVPTVWVMIEALPLTPNGKVDRNALPPPDLSNLTRDLTRRVASNPTEQTLATIWAEVLGLTEVGVTDNFFELGGDSILCIQVVARANQAGLRLSVRDLFEYQTVAELATAAARELAAVTTSASANPVHVLQDIEVRDVPLTPIQNWFFAQPLDRPHHWNQALLLETRRRIGAKPLGRAMRALTVRHAALRLRFAHETGRWRQRLLSEATWANETSAGVPVTLIDLTLLAGPPRLRALERGAAQAQASLDLRAGPLLRAVLFELGGKQRLLLAAHHLVMDGVSWRVLLGDLQRAYEQTTDGAAVELGLVGGSFAEWAERLAAFADSEEIKAQAGYWEVAERAAREFRLPSDVRGGTNIEASTEQVTVKLTAEHTRALLQEVPRVYRTQINDALLTALGRALSRWVGRRRVTVELEGHGREELGLDGLDVTRAVGWFTSLYPVMLEAEWGACGEALKTVKEQLRAVPGKGVGYGVWRFLRADGGQPTADAGVVGGEVSFNYLGQLDNVLKEDAPFAPAAESAGESRYGEDLRPFKLSVVASVRGGELVMSWKYSRNLHRHKAIERVAADYIEALREIIKHCRSVQAGSVTPSDFPMVNLSQQRLDRIISRVGKARLS